jgi:hypothetical protein
LKKIIIPLLLSSIGSIAFAGVTPYLLKPEVRYDDVKQILALGEDLTGKDFKFNINYRPGSLRIFRDYTYRAYECSYFDPSTVKMLPLHGCQIRVITQTQTEKVILIKYEWPEILNTLKLSKSFKTKLSFFKLHQMAGLHLNSSGVDYLREVFFQGKLAYLFQLKKTDAVIHLFIDPFSGKILGRTEESIVHSIDAEVYPVYEETAIWDSKSETMSLKKAIPEKIKLEGVNDIVLASLSPYFSEFVGEYNEELNTTYHPEARGKPGAWNDEDLEQSLKVESPSRMQLPYNQKILESEYISVLVHPSSANLLDSTRHFYPLPHVSMINKEQVWYTVIGESVYYPPIASNSNHSAVRDPQHDLKNMINNPTDAIHVFQATNQFFQTLKAQSFNEFKDEELKVRAYLYNQDSFYKDNAFYTKGTINFTTYSPELPNFARDKRVIWHELGHSIFDKLADYVSGQKGNGQNEGFSDFISHFVFRARGFSEDYPYYKSERIYSEAIFNIANQVHDDGEAFGGTLKDILEEKIKSDGPAAFPKTLELVFTTLKFIRGSIKMSEQEFFHTMGLVDNIPTQTREAGEFAQIISDVLQKRNFSLMDSEQTTLEVKINGMEASVRGDGSYNYPFKFKENPNATHEITLSLKLIEKKAFAVPYPYQMSLRFQTNNSRILDIESLSPKDKMIYDKDDSIQFKFLFKPVCLEYNLNSSSCRSAVRVEMNRPNQEQVFGRRRFFIQVNR